MYSVELFHANLLNVPHLNTYCSAGWPIWEDGKDEREMTGVQRKWREVYNELSEAGKGGTIFPFVYVCYHVQVIFTH